MSRWKTEIKQSILTFILKEIVCVSVSNREQDCKCYKGLIRPSVHWFYIFTVMWPARGQSIDPPARGSSSTDCFVREPTKEEKKVSQRGVDGLLFWKGGCVVRRCEILRLCLLAFGSIIRHVLSQTDDHNQTGGAGEAAAAATLRVTSSFARVGFTRFTIHWK